MARNDVLIVGAGPAGLFAAGELARHGATHRRRLVLAVSDAPRIISRPVDARRFLIGDAAYLSSPFAGEGLNAGLHDGYDRAWRLALVVLIRPDGHIGFRFPSADTGALAALDRHLCSYLIPDPTVGPVGTLL
jgi:2-polyprenyl-6-methoxyphenol hydroxylase-like FAD-dependent oxidoreductase